MANPWQMPKSCEQEGVEAEMLHKAAREEYRRTGDYDAMMNLPGDVYRKAHYLEEEGSRGHSTVCAGTVFGKQPEKSEDIADVAERQGPGTQSVQK